MLETLIKRSGEREAFQNSKTNGWVLHVGRDILSRMNWSQIVIEARNTAPTEMSSQDWQMHLISLLKVRGSQDDGWPYMLMAGRLYTIYQMKKLHGDTYPSLKEFQAKMVEIGYMRDLGYSDAEYAYLDKYVIKHENNMAMAWSQVEQYNLRYSLRDFTTKESFETPQFTMMRMAMAVYEKEPEETRLSKVKAMYEDLSDDLLNPPSPNYSALGTRHYGMASCCLIAATDEAQSIKIAGMIGYDMTLSSGGLGIDLAVRAPGDAVDGGRVSHAGRLNYQQKLVGDTIANKQGPRGGAVTMEDIIYSPEVELNVMMQNERTPVELRDRRLNIAVKTNAFFVKKARDNEKYFTFTIHSAPDLWEAFHKADQTEFEQLYAKYEADPNFKKDYRSAKETLTLVGGQEIEQSTLFGYNAPEANRHSPFKDPVRQSNLCVAPETEILTDQGYFPIADLENRDVAVWNGQEFSETTVVRTSESSELLKVNFNNGLSLECTPYHKFYIQTGYDTNNVKEIRACDLKPGMALIKMDLPVIEGYYSVKHPYVNGFFSGDGCDTPQGQRIYLYGDKRKLRGEFPDGGKWTVQDKQDREYTHYQDLEAKYFVPMSNFTLDTRLEWFAGICDSDGTISRNGSNQSLQLTSTNSDFLKQIVLMLQTMGVNARIGKNSPGGEQMMPDGRGGSTLYMCKPTERLLVTSGDLQHLLSLGINFRRLKVAEHTPQRSAAHFVRVTDVEDTGRVDATFCFTEPKRHMGVFNGILTGQCMEVINPTTPWKHVLDLYDPAGHPSKGETGMCNIGSIPIHNLPFDVNNPRIGMDKYKRSVRSMMEIVDYAIENSEYHYPAIATQARSRRNCSIGMSGVGTLFAKLNLKFNTPEGRKVWHMLNERHMYACIEVALEMGKEHGNAPWINGPNNDGVHGTKWVDGWMPIDTYKKTIDTVVDSTLYFDWECLRARVVENKGIRFSSLVAHMPGEQATRKGTGSNSVLLLQALSVDLSDGTSAMPWAALDNDLIGHQYQLAWDLSDEDVCIHYGICQKFTDQSISADSYDDFTGDHKVTDKYLIQRAINRIRYGMKTWYYNRSLLPSVPTQGEIPALKVEPVTDTSQLSALERSILKAKELQSQSGASCTLDGACGA